MKKLILILLLECIVVPVFAVDAYLNKNDRKNVASDVIRSSRSTCMSCGKSIFCGDMYGFVGNRNNLRSYCKEQNSKNNVSFSGNKETLFGADGSKHISYSKFVRFFNKEADKPNFYYIRDKRDFVARRFSKTNDKPADYVEYLNFLSSGNREGKFELPAPVVLTPVVEAPALSVAEPAPIEFDLSPTPVAEVLPDVEVAPEAKVETAVAAPIAAPAVVTAPAVLDCARDWQNTKCWDERPSTFATNSCEDITSYNSNKSTRLFKDCDSLYQSISTLSECSQLNSELLKVRSGVSSERRRRDRVDVAAILGTVEDPIIANGFSNRIKKPSAEYNRETLDRLNNNLSNFYNRYERCKSSRTPAAGASQ